MAALSHLAAQYIRMSTDRQDLSPAVQKAAIAAYAAAREMEVVATYEDDGRSGVHLKNRPALLRLLRDVTESPQFSSVLVYDVSRWGRFQDTDAAAYYEYHCRLRGVEVVYVAEMFGPEITPITAMIKSWRRSMVAQQSRDLAVKCRAGQHLVVSRGYQMGPLPPLGYRRCSVSADGQRRLALDNGQRKFAAADRVEWVLAPPEEVELVKRICDLYARVRLPFSDIAELGSSEGWRDHKGQPMTRRAIATLVRHEALIGNFVWGRGKSRARITSCAPSRCDGCLPKLIDSDTWAQIQQRAAFELSKKKPSPQEMALKLSNALRRTPLLAIRDFRAQGLPHKMTVLKRLGAWTECLQRAGSDPNEHERAIALRAQQRREDGREFARELALRLGEEGHLVAFNGKRHLLDISGLALRPRLLWPTLGESGRAWPIRIERTSRPADFDLLVRMEDRFRPLDFLVVPPGEMAIRFPPWLAESIPSELARFWCRSPQQLLDRISAISQRNQAVH